MQKMLSENAETKPQHRQWSQKMPKQIHDTDNAIRKCLNETTMQKMLSQNS